MFQWYELVNYIVVPLRLGRVIWRIVVNKDAFNKYFEGKERKALGMRLSSTAWCVRKRGRSNIPKVSKESMTQLLDFTLMP